MAYEKTNWIDHVVDSETGEIIQQGTRFTAQRMNNIEKGIDDAHSELDELKGLDGKIKVELIPNEGLNVDQVDGLHVDDTNSGSSEEEKNALWSAKKVKEITDELGSQIGQIATQKGHTKTITKVGADTVVTDRLGGNIVTVETISKSGNIVTSVLKDSTGKIIETRTISKAIDGITEVVV